MSSCKLIVPKQLVLFQVNALGYIWVRGGVVNRRNARPRHELVGPELRRRRESLNQILVTLSHHSSIQELVHRVLLASLAQHLQVIVHVRHSVRRDGARRGRARRTDAREAAVPAPQQAVHGSLEVGERERQEFAQYARLRRAAPRRPSHAVRAPVPPEERLVGQGRADNGKLEPVADVGYRVLDRSEENLDALLFVRLVLLRSGREFLPRLVRFTAR
mmetsp:Transcript_23566/g.53493  ORF Transcript_23566/g.53493 Transcript_23566/m.53493 type:complete len:218 (-) Transcript_23566:328-981(-)